MNITAKFIKLLRDNNFSIDEKQSNDLGFFLHNSIKMTKLEVFKKVYMSDNMKSILIMAHTSERVFYALIQTNLKNTTWLGTNVSSSSVESHKTTVKYLIEKFKEPEGPIMVLHE